MSRCFRLDQTCKRQRDVSDDGGDDDQVGPCDFKGLVAMACGAVKGSNLVENRLSEIIHKHRQCRISLCRDGQEGIDGIVCDHGKTAPHHKSNGGRKPRGVAECSVHRAMRGEGEDYGLEAHCREGTHIKQQSNNDTKQSAKRK